MRRLTREQWFWYAAYPAALFAGLLVIGLFIAGGNTLVVNDAIFYSIGGAIAMGLAGWWIIHMAQPPSKRATDLSISSFFTSVFLSAIPYALPIGRGILYSFLEMCSLVLFVPGLLCVLYYWGMVEDEKRPLIVRGQRIIIGGFLSFIYVGIGSYSIKNITSAVFHVELPIPQVWLWIGRAGSLGGTLAMGIGVLFLRSRVPLAMGENPRSKTSEKQTWGETVQGLTFVTTMVGVFLSGFSISALGGLVVILAGLILYPVGWLVTKLFKPRTSSNTIG